MGDYTEKDLRRNLAKNLKKYMLYEDINQKELAYISKLSEGTISRLLNEQITPSVKCIVNLSLALNVRADRLLYF